MNFKEYDKIIKEHKYDMMLLMIYYNLTCNDKFETLTDLEKETLIHFIYRAYLKDETNLDLGYICDKAMEYIDIVAPKYLRNEDMYIFLGRCYREKEGI